MTNLTPRAARLAKALADAKTAALAVEGTEDGGTCNFDSLFVASERGLTAAVVEAAANVAGVTVRRSSGGWWNGWFVGGVERGQGAMRTRMVEAACVAMKEAGEIGATVYYAMD